MKKVKVIGIKWDADNLEDVKHLPTEMILDVPSHVEDEDDLEEFIADELSNQSGFTHDGWGGYELVEEQVNDIPSLRGMSFDQFEELDGAFTYPYYSGFAEGYCASNGMVHCKVEGAYEWFFANRKDAFERLMKDNREVPYAYLELNNGFDVGSLLSCLFVLNQNHRHISTLNNQEFCITDEAVYKLNELGELLVANIDQNQCIDMDGFGIVDEDMLYPETKELTECFFAGKYPEGTVNQQLNANNYTTRQLIEMEFQNVPKSEHKDDLIIGALQLTENGYTVREAVSASLEITGLLQLSAIEDNFLTFVGEWINGQDCRTGENRVDGTVTYLRDGLYLYEFKTREDAFKYLFEDDRSVPYAFAEYDEKASVENGEESFGEWEFNNGFTDDGLQTLGLNDKKTKLLSLIFDMSVNGVNLIDISKEKNFVDIVDSDDTTFQIFTQDGTVTVDWGEGENAIDVYADSSVNEELVKAFRYQMFPLFTMEQVFDYLQSKK